MASTKRLSCKGVPKQVATISLDIPKRTVHFAALDATGHVLTCRQYIKVMLLRVTATVDSCRIGMEGCCGSHHLVRIAWALVTSGQRARWCAPAREGSLNSSAKPNRWTKRSHPRLGNLSAPMAHIGSFRL